MKIRPRSSVGAELACRCCRVMSKHNSIYQGSALADLPLNAFEYNPTHLVQLTSTSSPYRPYARERKQIIALA
jgi:hypothetical protein